MKVTMKRGRSISEYLYRVMLYLDTPTPKEITYTKVFDKQLDAIRAGDVLADILEKSGITYRVLVYCAGKEIARWIS